MVNLMKENGRGTRRSSKGSDGNVNKLNCYNESLDAAETARLYKANGKEETNRRKRLSSKKVGFKGVKVRQ